MDDNGVLKQHMEDSELDLVVNIDAVGEMGLIMVSRIYDILGREVKMLINEFKTAAYYGYTFNADKLSSGIYFYRIESGSFTETKKMLIIK